jgi:hypothetical protein
MQPIEFIQPPPETSSGCRKDDGSMWFPCNPAPDRKPGIVICEHAGNWINPPTYTLVAVFERAEDRDFVLQLHQRAVTRCDE